MENNMRNDIVEAIEEATILECALDRFDERHIMYVAHRLSNAPLSSVEKVYYERKKVVDLICV